MKHYLLLILLSLFITATPARAQDDAIEVIEGNPAAEIIAEEPIVPAPDLQLKDTKTREFEDAPILRLRILDKVRAESRTYELNVGRTVAYGTLRIRPRACRKSSPLDEPESASFLQIWEVKPDDSSAWVFSGWMFASSPSLSGMDHPVYDVTVLECKLPVKAEEPKAETENEPAGDEDATAEPTEDQESEEEPATDETVTDDAPSTNETPETPSADSSLE